MCFTFILISCSWHTKQGNLFLTHLCENCMFYWQHKPKKKILFFYFSSPVSRAFSGRLQKGEASSSSSCARSTETPASLRLPVSAPPLRLAAPTTPPVFLEIRIIGGAGKSPRYGTLRGPLKNSLWVIYSDANCTRRAGDCPLMLPSGDEPSRETFLDLWIFPVKSVPGKRPRPMFH